MRYAPPGGALSTIHGRYRQFFRGNQED